MKNPFTTLKKSFEKNVLRRSVSRKEIEVKEINKPVEQIVEEKRKTEPPKHETKRYCPSPYFDSQRLAKIRKHRKVHNHIQAASRRINLCN